MLVKINSSVLNEFSLSDFLLAKILKDNFLIRLNFFN